MVEIGKECGFPSNSDMMWPLTPCKTELPCKIELQPSKSPNNLLHLKVKVEQRIHSGDETELS